MTSPYTRIAPPNNPYGRTAKELAGYTNIRPGTPSGGIVVPLETVPILTTPGIGYALTAMPAALSGWASFQRPWIDPKGYTVVRIIADVSTAGAAGSVLVLRVTLTPANPASWRAVGASGAEAVVDISMVGPQQGTDCIIDTVLLLAAVPLCWQVCSINGDGVVTPILGMACIQFDLGLFQEETLYWRNFAPGNVPTPPLTFAPHYEAWGTTEPGPVLYTTPTPSDVATNARVLSPTHPPVLNTGQSFQGIYTGTGIHSDFGGPGGRLVGAPLAAQHIRAFVYRTAWAGICPTGTAAAMLGCYMGIWRAATDTIEVISSIGGGASGGWFRYIPKLRIVSNMYGMAIDVLDGDRLVIEFAVSFDVAPGYGNVYSGICYSIGYDGGTDAGTVDGSDSGLAIASYTVVPKLRYLDPDPTVAYP